MASEPELSLEVMLWFREEFKSKVEVGSLDHGPDEAADVKGEGNGVISDRGPTLGEDIAEPGDNDPAVYDLAESDFMLPERRGRVDVDWRPSMFGVCWPGCHGALTLLASVWRCSSMPEGEARWVVIVGCACRECVSRANAGLYWNAGVCMPSWCDLTGLCGSVSRVLCDSPFGPMPSSWSWWDVVIWRYNALGFEVDVQGGAESNVGERVAVRNAKPSMAETLRFVVTLSIMCSDPFQAFTLCSRMAAGQKVRTPRGRFS
jgi:hypothetical protein